MFYDKQSTLFIKQTNKTDKSKNQLKVQLQCVLNLLLSPVLEYNLKQVKQRIRKQQADNYVSQITGMENTKGSLQKKRWPETAQVCEHFSINIGILIDDNYSFVLSEWKQNKIQGPFFMVYPDESILYGFIENQKIGEFVCYEVNKEFIMILSKNTNVILVDLLPSSSILVFKVDKKFLDQHTLSSILKRKDQHEANLEINAGIELLSQEEYANSEEKYKMYSKNLSVSNIPDYLKTYDIFIKEKFNSTPQKIEIVEMLKSRQDLTISFKNCAITLFLKLYLQNNETKMLGSMNKYENTYEFYRKIMHTSNSVQEFVTKSKNPFTAEYNLRPNIRPKQCSIQLCNFHKSAVTYTDQFVNVTYMYGIKQNLQKVNELINIFVTNKLAQVQLQNSRYDPRGQEMAKKPGPINYTLEQVQQQIYDAVKRKRQNTGKKVIAGLSPNRSISEYPTYANKSADKYARSQIKNIDSASRNTNTPYIRALNGEDQVVQSRLNRSKSYLNVSNVTKNYELRATPSKNTPKKTGNNPYTASGKKYSYLDDVQVEKIQPKQVRTPIKYEPYMNMKRLTDDYENIQKEMDMSTPNKSSYRLDNSVYRKSILRTNEFDAYNQSTNVKHAPLSQKKVFKYLPN